MSTTLCCSNAALETTALSLARSFGFNYVKFQTNPAEIGLLLTPEYLQLNIPGMKPIIVDFVRGKAQHRRLYGGGKNQAIAKACGIKPKISPTIVDVTAGLGKDAFVLASLGANVTLVERNPVMAALLQDGLTRLYAALTPSSAMNLRLHFGDAQDFLTGLTQQNLPDVIYLDPMHPERTKSALVKKEMRILRELVGSDLDKTQLFTTARNIARQRVVVKWPRQAAPISTLTPDVVYAGKSTRFEVYLTKNT